VRDDVRTLLDELAGIGIPDALVHGDLHTGNIALEDGVPVLYDWSDAAISHPFLDLVLLCERLSDEERVAARAAYLDVWRSAYPAVDLDRALELAGPANAVFQMVSYEHIYRAQEDASYWEMSGVVARSLRELPTIFGRPD
jgi:aminoglycoside phosphotransferase (APT) family kinase protein